MRKFFNNRHGFTLVELMITVVIIGVLAAVAIPLYQGNVTRAKTSEADAALGTIRTALRVYYAEFQAYPTQVAAAEVTTISGLNFVAADLNGTYFNADEYTYKSAAGVAYTIEAAGTGSQAGINRRMDQDGALTNF